MARTPIPCPECDREKYFEGLCYACEKRHERLRYEAMSDADVAKAVQHIARNIHEVDEMAQAYRDFKALLAYHDINTAAIAQAACAAKVFFPPELYRDADDSVQQQLIALLQDPQCHSGRANAVLSCLGVCGSPRAQAALQALQQNPKPWRQKLHVDPDVYAECGGWTWDASGQRQALVYPDCYALSPGPREDIAVQVATPKDGHCPHCGCGLVHILEIDGRDARLAFLNMPGPIKLPLCPNCASMSEKTLMRYAPDAPGSFEVVGPFSDENYINADDYKKMTERQLVLSAEKKPVYYACGPEETSTIGGMADWIQDWQYENCPDCQRKMKQLGALVWDTVLPGSEGTLYIQHCPDCQVAAAFHQQT